jgi:hypothetical protein
VVQRTPVDEESVSNGFDEGAHVEAATVAAAEARSSAPVPPPAQSAARDLAQQTAPPMQTHRVPDAVVQRAMAVFAPPPAISVVPASNVSVVQRAAGNEPIQEQPAQVDLDALARDVYPILRRMLEVDRERRTRF